MIKDIIFLLILLLISLQDYNNYNPLRYKEIMVPIFFIGVVLGSCVGFFWYEVEKRKKDLNKIARFLEYFCLTLFALIVISYIISFWGFFLYGKFYLFKYISGKLTLQTGIFAFIIYIFRWWKNRKYFKKDSSKEDTIIF